MKVYMLATTPLIQDLWSQATLDEQSMDALETLRYRSNLLGADLRITNFGGGNTSSKYDAIDPFTGKPARVMAVKGSGGDLGSIGRSGFAVLYMDRLEQLHSVYRGEQHEDEMVAFYPSCAFGNSTAPSDCGPGTSVFDSDGGETLVRGVSANATMPDASNARGMRIMPRFIAARTAARKKSACSQ